MKVFTLVLVLLCGLAGISQEYNVKGQVLSSGNAQAGAVVYLGGMNQQTDSMGMFEAVLQRGSYKLSIQADGYDNFQKSVDIISDTFFVFDLGENHSTMGEIVITGTSRPVTKMESPVSVESYSPQFFKKNPAPSIFESLQNINGVRPQINCSVCNTGDIHINGLEGPYTMITIDGMPIVSSLASVYGLYGIPSQLIERVEILKGPASSLYGSEAIGGLINIITKSPEKAPLFSASLLTTSWLEHNIDLGLKWKMGKKVQSMLGLHLFAFQEVTDNNNDGFTDVPLQERFSVFNKWTINRKENRIGSIAFRYFKENRWGGQNQWNKSYRGGDDIYGESIYTNRWEAITAYQLPFREKIIFNGSATGHNQDSYYGDVYYKGRQDVLFGQLKWERSVGNNHLLVGLAGRYNYYDDNSTATIDTSTSLNRPEKTFIPGLFIQDELITASNQQLLVGLRLDHHPVHKLIFTPRLAYKINFNARQVLRLNAGTGFRVVNLFTEEHAALTGSRAVEIQEALKPEKSFNVNLNYVLHSAKRSFGWSVDASVWYTHFSNQIIPDYTTDPNKIIYNNLSGHSVSKGFSINTEWNLRQRLKGMAGITLQDVYRKDEGKPGKERQMFTESWSGTWLLSYNFPSIGLSVDYTGNIYGPMQLPLISDLDPRPATSPVWSLQNIQFTKWVSREFEFFAGVKNLLNWTPGKGLPFLIARADDPFNKNVVYDANGQAIPTTDNPYGLTFDPGYIYASNQGLRVFGGLRWNVR